MLIKNMASNKIEFNKFESSWDKNCSHRNKNLFYEHKLTYVLILQIYSTIFFT